MDHTALELIELGAVFFGLGLRGGLAARIGMSPIPLYLLGGLCFGTGGLVPLGDIGDFTGLAGEVGALLLGGDLGEHRGDHPAGRAPRRPEVDEHRALGAEHQLVEGGVGDGHETAASGRSPRPAVPVPRCAPRPPAHDGRP